MLTTILISVGSLLIGGLIVFLLLKKVNKKTINVAKLLGKSEKSDENRNEDINTADTQVNANNKLIEKAKNLIKKNKEVIKDAKKNTD